MDYGTPERRKNRNDRKAKSKYNKYKLGGRFRSSTVDESKSGKQTN